MTAFEPIELFIADPHGEYEEFHHILRTADGELARVVDTVMGTQMTAEEKAELICLLAYPDEKIASFAKTHDSLTNAHWLEGMLEKARMIGQAVCPSRIETDSQNLGDIARDIRESLISQLHVMGDIYDRGPLPDAIMDDITAFPRLDIQWGNHDILWMGAALGEPALVATAVRICARYGNLDVLEQNYGMDLSTLRTFARTQYADDPVSVFFVKHNPGLSDEERLEVSRVQKAIAIIQFKVEAQVIARNPSFCLESRNLLGHIDFTNGTVEVDGVTLPMLDMHFPTVNPTDPYALTADEQAVLDSLIAAFTSCERLQRHIRLFLERGSLYKIDGDNLLFHACVPLNDDGTLKQVELFGTTYAGKALYDAVDRYVRDAFTQTDAAARQRGLDLLWYLWLGQGSPLFAKSKMATFELYFVEDKAARKEHKNAFYTLMDNEAVMNGILEDFSMNPETGRMICGHVPVKVKDGESPVRCGGKVLMIDGGMSKPYQKNTGIAGFSLVKDSSGMRLATHQTFCGTAEAVETNASLETTWQAV